VYGVMKEQKSPKVLSDSLLWIHTMLTEFGIQGIALKELTDFLQFAIGNSNATVRSSTVTVLSDLRIFVGPGIL
jgi:cytoskeleton-associated protein 5